MVVASGPLPDQPGPVANVTGRCWPTDILHWLSPVMSALGGQVRRRQYSCLIVSMLGALACGWRLRLGQVGERRNFVGVGQTVAPVQDAAATGTVLEVVGGRPRPMIDVGRLLELAVGAVQHRANGLYSCTSPYRPSTSAARSGMSRTRRVVRAAGEET